MNIGSVFHNRYEIRSTLGKGGFADVYAAVDQQTEQTVAIKVLSYDDGGAGYEPSTAARFAREVGLLSGLRSPHTVRLLGHGNADGQLYAVFEQIEGRDLSALLESVGRLEPQWALHILGQVLESLREAHMAGLVHRDLKPANIRVFERDGDPMSVKLLDFGIARMADESHPSITTTGELIGTPRYMSPEQLIDEPLSAASDIYSLGIVGFELLMGGDALQGNRWGDQLDRLASGHVFGVPESENWGEPLIALLRRMTARAPADRYQSAASVLTGIAQIQAPMDADATVSPFDDTANTDEPRSSPPAQLESASAGYGGVVLAVVLVLIIAIATIWVRSGAPEHEPSIPSALLKTPDPTEPALAAIKDIDEGSDAASDAASDAGSGASGVPDPTRLPVGRTPGTGCGKPPPMTGEYELDGVLTWVSPNYRQDRPHPLIILLHNDIQRPSRVMSKSDLRDVAERQQALIIAPPGGNYPLYDESWRYDAQVDWVETAYRRTAEQYCIDDSRIFIVANGEGGRAAYALSCEPWVRGIAIVANLVHSAAQPFQCRGDLDVEPKPTIIVSPTQSNIVPFDGRPNCTGGEKEPVERIEDAWRRRNRCSQMRTSSATHADGECHTWDCEQPFESCFVRGGEPWPREQHASFRICSEAPPGDFPVANHIEKFFEALHADE